MQTYTYLKSVYQGIVLLVQTKQVYLIKSQNILVNKFKRWWTKLNYMLSEGSKRLRLWLLEHNYSIYELFWYLYPNVEGKATPAGTHYTLYSNELNKEITNWTL